MTPEQYSLDEPLTRPSTSRRPLEYDVDIPELTPEDTHLASLAEKKRLWWRNATVNTLFIGSWYVIVLSNL
jgi:solute carrier family 35 protein C2